MAMRRNESAHAKLVKAGFADPLRAEQLINDPILASVDKDWLITNLRLVADPDQGLLAYLRLLEAATARGKSAMQALYLACQEPNTTRRLFAILGMSSALSEQLIANPTNVHILQDYKMGTTPFATTLGEEKASALTAIKTRLVSAGQTATQVPITTLDLDNAINTMRLHYWYRITQLVAADLTTADCVDNMPAVSSAISDVVGGALEAALAIARTHIPNATKVGLSIVAMGKTGAREVNYISDVDVLYVARSLDPALVETEMLDIATQMATYVTQIVFKPAEVASLWELDANLRPEGKDGPLVRTLESYLSYYQRWAQGWEFQALLKARPIAGDMELGEQFVTAVNPLVWSVAERESFVEDSRAMRRRVEDLVPVKDASRQLKLGKGGLRDVEFTVQLLQLVHGRTDESIRVSTTLAGLDKLANGGYISRAAAQKFAAAYRFLRTLEHRIQIQRFHRSHLVPTVEAELRKIARSLSGLDLRDAADLEKYFHDVQKQVRTLHLEIYYRPLLPEVAKLSADDISLDTQAATARLASMGYRDPASALMHIRALTSGISRTALIQRQLLPVMIGWFAAGSLPDQGLRAFRIISEQMGGTSWYMRTLRDSANAAERLAKLLSSSHYIATALPALSESIAWLDDDQQLQPRSRHELEKELVALISRRSDAQRIAHAARYLRRKELMRTAMAQILGLVSAQQVAQAISVAGDIAVSGALQGAMKQTLTDFSLDQVPIKFSVIAMGRFGGNELSYASDADLLFVHQPLAGIPEDFATSFAVALAKNLITLLSNTDTELAFPADAKLRPEGKNGSLSRSLASYREYYARWLETWEMQALLRARPCVGDVDLTADFMQLIDTIRYPESGLSTGQLREIRSIKARMENERMPRGVDPTRHLKLGRGGLSDVEWCAQLLQLQHGYKYPSLRTTDTLETLREANRLDLLATADLEQLITAWTLASQIRDFNVLGTGRTQGIKIDLLPHESDDLAVVGAMLGYRVGQRREVEEDYLHATRLARQVAERIFYGDVGAGVIKP